MRSSVVPVLYWSYWGNILYILGMFGYLTIDTISYISLSFSNTFICLVYICLAVIFVIDAILYTIDWYMYAVKLRENKDEPIQYRAEFLACIFQNLGSYFYLTGALLSFNKIQLMDKILLLNLIGITAFLLESAFTFLGWQISLRKRPPNNPNRGCTCQDVYMWAHTLNTTAGLIYLCATTLAYRLYINLKIIGPNGVLIIQILGDLVYLCDAYLYYRCWQRDKQEYDYNTERQQLIKFNLENQLTAEKLDTDINMYENK